jgi:hypothetical protein
VDFAKWVDHLMPTGQKLSDWDARKPHFVDLDELDDEDWMDYKPAWQQAACNNGFLHAVASLTENDYTSFTNFSSRFLQIEDIIDMTKFSKRMHDMVRPFVKLVLGLNAVLDPMPFAYGASSSDVYYIWPPPPTADRPAQPTFADEWPDGKIIIRSLDKNTVLMKALSVWKRFGGAEASVGEEWHEIFTEGQDTARSIDDAIDRGDDELLQEAEQQAGDWLRKFSKARPEALQRLRPGATLPLDNLCSTIVRRRWKDLQSSHDWDDDSQAETAAIYEIIKDIGVLQGVATAMHDRMAENKEAAKQGFLSGSINTSIETLAQTVNLYEALRANVTVPKTDDQIDDLRARIPELHIVLCKTLDAPPTDLDEFNYITGSLTYIVNERGIVGQDPNDKKCADGALDLVKTLTGWCKTFVAFGQQANHTRSFVLRGLADWKAWDELLSKPASDIFPGLHSDTQNMYQDRCHEYGTGHTCLLCPGHFQKQLRCDSIFF